MIQFLDVNATGIIGHISRLNNKGTRVIVYVNHVDERGNQIGRERLCVFLYNDAERTVLKNNAKPGDTLIIREGKLSLNQTEENGELVSKPTILCTWYKQVSVVAGNNHQALMSRNHTAVA